MLDLSALRLTDEQIYSVTSIHPRFVRKWPGTRAIADTATAKALEGVQVWLESYEDPLVKGMGKWLRDQLAD